MDIGNSWGKTYKGFIDPVVAIKVGSGELDLNTGKKGMCVTNVHVEKTVGCEASICRVLISAIATPKEGYDQPFLKKLPLGSKIEIKLGYLGKLDTVFVGYITGLDVEYNQNQSMSVLVTGMDGKVWMMSNKKSELKKEIKKYSDAVRDVFKGYKGKFSAIGSSINISGEPSRDIAIYQSNESDYEFVCRMAYSCGALFFIDNGKFNFVDMYSGKSSNKTFDNSIISSISTSINICGIPKKVEVAAQNPKSFRDEVKGVALKSQDIGKGKSASSLSKNVNSVVTIVDSSISSVSEANFASEAEQNRRNFNLVNIKVVLIHGIPNLELGKIYKIKGVSEFMDNDYMLVGVEHDMSHGSYKSIVYLNSTRSNVAKGGIL